MRRINYSSTIKNIRNELIITQSELADFLGVCYASVNRWENNQTLPTTKVKRKIVKMCNDKEIEIVYEE